MPTFDRDKWGRPWARCGPCTHPTPERCRSRCHPALCAHLAQNPAAWGPLIAEMEPCDDPPRDVGLVEHEPPPVVLAGPAPEPPLPGLAKRAMNLVGAAGIATTHFVTTGELTASNRVQEARWRVCKRGEGLEPSQLTDGHCDRFRPSDAACSECGCNLPAKISLAAMRCPLGRWPE